MTLILSGRGELDHRASSGVHDDEPRFSGSGRGETKGAVTQVKGKPMNVLAAVGGSPMSKAEGNIVKESSARLGERLHRTSHNDDHVKKEERVIFVGR